jgi:hypothetical protein
MGISYLGHNKNGVKIENACVVYTDDGPLRNRCAKARVEPDLRLWHHQARCQNELHFYDHNFAKCMSAPFDAL